MAERAAASPGLPFPCFRQKNSPSRLCPAVPRIFRTESTANPLSLRPALTAFFRRASAGERQAGLSHARPKAAGSLQDPFRRLSVPAFRRPRGRSASSPAALWPGSYSQGSRPRASSRRRVLEFQEKALSVRAHDGRNGGKPFGQSKAVLLQVPGKGQGTVSPGRRKSSFQMRYSVAFS